MVRFSGRLSLPSPKVGPGSRVKYGLRPITPLDAVLPFNPEGDCYQKFVLLEVRSGVVAFYEIKSRCVFPNNDTNGGCKFEL
jgi:hypothetical protein